MNEFPCKIIARIQTDLPEKFGIPRQSGLAKHLKGRIIAEPPYRDAAAFQGLEGYSHIWLIWLFSQNKNRETPSLTVRPPRLGGNKRVGVFATRSPYRPNPIGLSSVRLDRVSYDPALGPVLEVSGIDLADGTPILDIKPYLAYADSHPDAVCGFTDEVAYRRLQVDLPADLAAALPAELQAALTELLAEDPRPHYQNDPDRIYGMTFAGYAVKFLVNGDCLTVISVQKITS